MSSYSGEAADQVVRMILEGTEFAVRLAGAGARHLAVLLYAVLRDTRKTRGKVRLTNLLRSGRELKVFAVRDADLRKFCAEVKRYGVLYTVLKDRDAQDGLTDILVRAEDAGKISRIFERFHLATVDVGSVQARSGREAGDRQPEPDLPLTAREKAEAFLDELLSTEGKEGQERDPMTGRAGRSPQSVPFSGRKPNTVRDASDRDAFSRPSVKKELAQIREEMRESAVGIREPVKRRSPLKNRTNER